jgi:putative CocE/NonD family hydrolase
MTESIIRQLIHRKMFRITATYLALAWAVVASVPAAETSFSKDIYIPMQDGTKIAVAIYRPEGPGPFPTLFAASPYRYDNNELPASPQFLWRETGPIDTYVERGYAYVHADVRGSGQSEGEWGLLDHKEQRDYYDIIEWIARQPWSNGKVGGIGQSYYAMAQWHMAIQQPPHLACIAPYDGQVDLYRGSAYQGGIQSQFYPAWFDLIRAINLNPANGAVAREMKHDLENAYHQHQLYDEFWRERSAYEHLSKINVPVFSIGVWAKLNLHLRGNILGYQLASGPKKLLIIGAPNPFAAAKTFSSPSFHEKFLLPFYDWCLKGVDNGFLETPNVRYALRGTDAMKVADSWPPAGISYQSYYLNAEKSDSVASLNDGGLGESPLLDGGVTSYRYPNPGWVIGVVGFGKTGPDPVRRVLTFTSAPLEADLEVTGSILLELYASSSRTDTDFIVKLSDQMPIQPDQQAKGVQPAFSNVSKGWLKASHREKDLKRSDQYIPYFPHVKPSPIEPGKTYKFEVPLRSSAYVFKKGHRIRLEIVNGDSPVTDFAFSHYYHPNKIGEDTIHHSASFPSRVLLPIMN